MKLIDELARVLLMTDREFEQYLNKDTGEILFMRDRSEGQGTLAQIPEISSPEMYDLMMMFAKDQSEESAFELSQILNEPRPRQKFREKLIELGLMEKWEAFEDEYAKQRMVDWLYEIGVSTTIREEIERGS